MGAAEKTARGENTFIGGEGSVMHRQVRYFGTNHIRQQRRHLQQKISVCAAALMDTFQSFGGDCGIKGQDFHGVSIAVSGGSNGGSQQLTAVFTGGKAGEAAVDKSGEIKHFCQRSTPGKLYRAWRHLQRFVPQFR